MAIREPKTPLIRFNSLSGEIYCLTAYRTFPRTGVLVASRKFVVTTEVMVAMSQRQQWLRSRKRQAKNRKTA